MTGDGAPTTPTDDAETAFVERLVRQIGGHAAPMWIGQGSNNCVYRLQRDGEMVALKLSKPHRIGFAAEEYAKELWCACVARARGVPTPKVLDAGSFEGRHYQLQAFVSGRPVTDCARAWEAMGQWAREIHAIPISGWGPRFSAGAFQGNWQAHIAYNISALTDDDPLLEMGVLDTRLSVDLKRRLERLAATPLAMGLCHGDIGVHNVLDDEGVLTLVDWGSAAAAAVPYYEINEILRAGRASPDEMEIFRHAYGLSDAQYAAIKAELPVTMALRDVDTLRWALDRQPSAVEEQAQRAKKALSAL